MAEGDRYISCSYPTFGQLVLEQNLSMIRLQTGVNIYKFIGDYITAFCNSYCLLKNQRPDIAFHLTICILIIKASTAAEYEVKGKIVKGKKKKSNEQWQSNFQSYTLILIITKSELIEFRQNIFCFCFITPAS